MSDAGPSQMRIAIVGAGPAGLTAAYILSKSGISVDVFESDPFYVGGISRTVQYKGFRFDIGGHRFFSKSEEVENLWTEILPDGIISRPRSSRLLYRGKFYSYPLQALEVLENLGIWQSFLCVGSYCKVKLRHRLGLIRSPENFEEWVVYNFGWRLYFAFFKAYTEKVWGIPCTEISADWAVQRIKGLSLLTTAVNILRRAVRMKPAHSGSKQIKTLIQSFRYPRLGPGMMWDAAKEKIVACGGKVIHGSRVTSLSLDPEQKHWLLEVAESLPDTDHAKPGSGTPRTLGPYDQVICSAPIGEVVEMIKPSLSGQARSAASQLTYRDFILVAVILNEALPFPDQWIYIHETHCRVGRIQNFKNWSPELLDGSGRICLGMEYFCCVNDDLWSLSDDELFSLAGSELASLGLAKQDDIVDGCVVRQEKAYPVYGDNYKQSLAVIKEELDQRCEGLHQVGRNGLHQYNNQDHSMMTAMLVARNILDPACNFDPWLVSQDAEYIEEKSADEGSEFSA